MTWDVFIRFFYTRLYLHPIDYATFFIQGTYTSVANMFIIVRGPFSMTENDFAKASDMTTMGHYTWPKHVQHHFGIWPAPLWWVKEMWRPDIHFKWANFIPRIKHGNVGEQSKTWMSSDQWHQCPGTLMVGSWIERNLSYSRALIGSWMELMGSR